MKQEVSEKLFIKRKISDIFIEINGKKGFRKDILLLGLKLQLVTKNFLVL